MGEGGGYNFPPTVRTPVLRFSEGTYYHLLQVILRDDRDNEGIPERGG